MSLVGFFFCSETDVERSTSHNKNRQSICRIVNDAQEYSVKLAELDACLCGYANVSDSVYTG
jgi:hypothetical protein